MKLLKLNLSRGGLRTLASYRFRINWDSNFKFDFDVDSDANKL